MKKLRMNVDELQVESFKTVQETRGRRGTVQANLMDNQNTMSNCGQSYSGCYVISDGGGCDFETMGCTFTADFDCMESANCP